jgi:hypothetical protein
MNDAAELARQTERALVAEGLVAPLTHSALRLSARLLTELNRPEWEQKSAREGLEVRSFCCVPTWDRL